MEHRIAGMTDYANQLKDFASSLGISVSDQSSDDQVTLVFEGRWEVEITPSGFTLNVVGTQSGRKFSYSLSPFGLLATILKILFGVPYGIRKTKNITVEIKPLEQDINILGENKETSRMLVELGRKYGLPKVILGINELIRWRLLSLGIVPPEPSREIFGVALVEKGELQSSLENIKEFLRELMFAREWEKMEKSTSKEGLRYLLRKALWDALIGLLERD